MARPSALVALLLCSAVCSAAAQPQTPGNGGPFANLGSADLTFTPPGNVTTVHGATTDPIAGLKVADLTQIIFSLGPCEFFATHFHPNGTEVLTGVVGQIDAFVLVNGNLIAQQLRPLNTIVFPQVHFYWNNQCTESVAQASVNSAMPGALFFLDTPPQLLATMPTVTAVQNLIATNSQGPADPTRLFTLLTNDCPTRCGLAPPAGPGAGAVAGAAAGGSGAAAGAGAAAGT